MIYSRRFLGKSVALIALAGSWLTLHGQNVNTFQADVHQQMTFTVTELLANDLSGVQYPPYNATGYAHIVYKNGTATFDHVRVEFDICLATQCTNGEHKKHIIAFIKPDSTPVLWDMTTSAYAFQLDDPASTGLVVSIIGAPAVMDRGSVFFELELPGLVFPNPGYQVAFTFTTTGIDGVSRPWLLYLSS